MPSFHLESGICVDDDECDSGNNDCAHGRSTCKNEVKAYTMVWDNDVAIYESRGRGFSCTCNDGLIDENGDGTVCSDPSQSVLLLSTRKSSNKPMVISWDG